MSTGDNELQALTEVTKSLAALSDEQRRNVLIYLNARYGGKSPAAVPLENSSCGQVQENHAKTEFSDVGALFDAANPQTEAERVLVVAYWTQVVEGASDFESFPVNSILKNIGHPVSNITRALDSMKDQNPRFVQQIAKSGTSRQARKRYRLSREGIKRVENMINQGGSNGNLE